MPNRESASLSKSREWCEGCCVKTQGARDRLCRGGRENQGRNHGLEEQEEIDPRDDLREHSYPPSRSGMEGNRGWLVGGRGGEECARFIWTLWTLWDFWDLWALWSQREML
jgi:hypothetical protein